MSMSHYALHPYPAYKPSGVEWLGDVPAHWDVRQLRNVLTGTNMRNQPDLPLLSVLRERGVILRDVSNSEENHNFIPDDLTNYKVVKNGQFAMNKMKAWQGSYGVSQSDGIVSPAYYVFDVQEVGQSYFHAATRSIAYVPFFAQASDGVRIGQWDLSQPRMREIPFLVPPAPEQRAIVRYLDHVDRRIRRYVGAKRKLIALLEEEKQAVVNRAVTRGLDPNVRLKPSGVEWLGDVPEHWETFRVGHFSAKSRQRFHTFTWQSAAYWTDRVHPWLNQFQVSTKALLQGLTSLLQTWRYMSATCHAYVRGSVLVGITLDKARNQRNVRCTHHRRDYATNIWLSSPRRRNSCRHALPGLTVSDRSAYRESLHGAISSDSGSTKAALTCEDIKRFHGCVAT